jgi:hypothetical protein
MCKCRGYGPPRGPPKRNRETRKERESRVSDPGNVRQQTQKTSINLTIAEGRLIHATSLSARYSVKEIPLRSLLRSEKNERERERERDPVGAFHNDNARDIVAVGPIMRSKVIAFSRRLCSVIVKANELVPYKGLQRLSIEGQQFYTIALDRIFHKVLVFF